MVIVRGDERNRGKWSLGVIVDLSEGRDQVAGGGGGGRGKQRGLEPSFYDRPS